MKSTRNAAKLGQIIFAVVFAIGFFSIANTSTAHAKPKKAKYGTIKILTNPGGLLISVDGKPYGQTTTDYRSIDLEPGLHTVVVTLPSGQLWTREIDLPAGRIKCIVLNYRPSPPPPKSPCPYPLNVSAPTRVNEGEIITYTSDVSYNGNASLTYVWTVSPGNARILSGAGSPTITVDSTGLGGQRITAALVVDDGSGDPSCRQATHASTTVPRPAKTTIVGREFDTCCSCSSDDLKARLDNLAVELHQDPTTTSYVIAYAGRTSATGQADRLLTKSRDYLLNKRGIDGSRLVLVNGGFREEDCLELWIVPRGAQPPRPTPTLESADARPTPAPATRRRRG